MWRLPTIGLLSLILTTAVQADTRLESGSDRIHLLELYTSEGCSSCPPADRWFSRLKDDPRLWHKMVPVAFHVDYWDDLGWPDRFAEPAFGDRQRDHVRSGRLSTVYTPGVVLDGAEWRGGFSNSELRLPSEPAAGTLRVRVAGTGAEATFTPATVAPPALELHLVVLGFGLSTEVKAGENQNRTLHHDFIVLGYRRVLLSRAGGDYHSATLVPAARFISSRTALAAWVSLPDDPRPLQAVGGWL